jgi:hypothetical protein
MTTDNTAYSTPAVWSVLYSGLKHSPWEADDVDDWQTWFPEDNETDYRPVAETLKWVYDRADKKWRGAFILYEAPLAVLKAALIHYGTAFLTPGQVKEMARHFAVYHDGIEEPMEEYLDEHCGPVGWHWLNEHGRQQVKEAVCKPTEIWIEDSPKLSGVYVFNRPTSQIEQLLDRARLVENRPVVDTQGSPG